MAYPVLVGTVQGNSPYDRSYITGGVQAGDWLYACVYFIGGDLANATAPAGFVELASDTWTFGGAYPSKMVLYRKLATASEPSSYDFTVPNGLGVGGGIACVRGGDSHVFAKLKDVSGSLTRFPSVTTTVDQALHLITGGAFGVGGGTGDWSEVIPSGFTPTEYQQGGFGFASRQQATAGATGIASQAQSASPTDTAPNVTFSVAIMPPGGPDVTPPTITSSATPTAVEGQVLNHALTANETVTWTKVSGADFTLTGSTLSLPAQTYPTGPLTAVVRATDTAGNSTDQTITVSITQAPLVSFVGSATGTNTATIPAHQAGDLIVAFAFRDGSNTQPTIPSANWSPIQNATGANTCSHVLVAKVATSSSETVGTFTNATSVVVQIYRPRPGLVLSIGANATQTGTATSATYSALTPQTSSFLALAFAGHRSVNTALENAPSGMVQRSTVVDATDEAAGFDTNGLVTAWSAQSVALGGTASGWRTAVAEIKFAVVGAARPVAWAFFLE